MDVILHLGAHRCGTTTLQGYLHRNRTPLADAGVAFWGPKRTRAGLFSGLIQRPSVVTPSIVRTGLRSCGAINIERRQLEIAGFRELIVSEENMLGTITCNLADGLLYKEAIGRIARFVDGFGDTPRRIALSIRAYDRLWASCLAYAIARGRPLPTRQETDALCAQPRTWRTLITELSAVFPRTDIVVWPFERFASQPDHQLYLMTDGLSIPAARQGNRDWLNRSLDGAALREIVLDRGEDASHAGLATSGAFMPFTPNQQALLRTQYAKDLAWLRGGAEGRAVFADTAPTKTDFEKTIKTSGFTRYDRDLPSSGGGRRNDSEHIMV